MQKIYCNLIINKELYSIYGVTYINEAVSKDVAAFLSLFLSYLIPVHDHQETTVFIKKKKELLHQKK